MELNDYLGYNLYRSALLFRRELIRALKTHDLTPEQWQTLASLWKKTPRSMSEISDITLQDLPSISRMIRRMEKNQWVTRIASPEDRRVQIIDLTKRGRELEQTLPPLLMGHFNRILNDFPAPHQAQLLALLKELRVALGDPIPGATEQEG